MYLNLTVTFFGHLGRHPCLGGRGVGSFTDAPSEGIAELISMANLLSNLLMNMDL